MTYKEREEQFLNELTALTHKYKIYIGGCGCCGSPYLDDTGEKVQVRVQDSEATFGFRFDHAPVDEVKYQYDDKLEFSKIKED